LIARNPPDSSGIRSGKRRPPTIERGAILGREGAGGGEIGRGNVPDDEDSRGFAAAAAAAAAVVSGGEEMGGEGREC
jgi:hypothetical protein